MFENNILFKLKRLRNRRMSQLKIFLKNNKDLLVNETFIDSIMLSIDYESDSRKIITEDQINELSKINSKNRNNRIHLTMKDMEILDYISNNYKYSKDRNIQVIEDIKENSGHYFDKEIYKDKYNILRTRQLSNMEYEASYKPNIIASEITENPSYINEALWNYLDAYRLYQNHYNQYEYTLEFNTKNKERRLWSLKFNPNIMPYLMGLPRYETFLSSSLARTFKEFIDEDAFVIDIFNYLARYHREEIIEHEKNAKFKINWERINVKNSAFKNFGYPEYGSISAYKKKNAEGIYIEKEAINPHVRDFIEIKLISNESNKETALLPVFINFSNQRRNSKEERIYLGFSSFNELKSINVMTGLKDNNIKRFDFYEYYLPLNQERLMSSAKMIYERALSSDKIILSSIDLDYLFISTSKYDDRMTMDDETLELVNDYYMNCLDKELSISSFKSLYNLAQRFKYSANINADKIETIKETLYLNILDILMHTKKSNQEILEQHKEYIKTLKNKYNK